MRSSGCRGSVQAFIVVIQGINEGRPEKIPAFLGLGEKP
jgi:hypothetical protein